MWRHEMLLLFLSFNLQPVKHPELIKCSSTQHTKMLENSHTWTSKGGWNRTHKGGWTEGITEAFAIWPLCLHGWGHRPRKPRSNRRGSTYASGLPPTAVLVPLGMEHPWQWGRDHLAPSSCRGVCESRPCSTLPLPHPSCSSSSHEMLKPVYSGSACNPNSPNPTPSSHGGGTRKQRWPRMQQTCLPPWCPGCPKQRQQLQQQQGTSNLRLYALTRRAPGGPSSRGGGGGTSVQSSRSVGSDSLRTHGLQHTRLPCPSPNPAACSNSCPLSQWCHPIMSSSVVPFSSCLQSFPASRVFSNESALCIKWPKYWSFSFSISPSNEYSGLISFRMDWLDLFTVQGLSRVFSKTTVQKHQFFGAQLSL